MMRVVGAESTTVGGGDTAIHSASGLWMALQFLREVVLPYEGDDCLTWPFAKGDGHAKVWQNGHLLRVARLVCESVNGPPPSSEHETAHSCGKGHKACVAKKHLRWATRTENENDKIVHGTTNRGCRNGQSKLTESDVRKIRSLKGIKMQAEIADRFGVHVVTIGSIHQGKAWAWLT